MGVALDLNNLAIEVRPRNAWQAVDLGILMARRWWWPLVKIWFCLSFPIFVILAFLPLDYLWLQATIVWWLKPYFEQALLEFLSRAVFGDEPSTKAVIKMWPRLLKMQWFSALTWRRLSISRSMNLPVTQLEGLSGRERSQRLDVLHREDSQPAGWLIFIGANLELFIALSAFLIFLSMVPQGVDMDMIGDGLKYLQGDKSDFWFEIVFNALFYIFAIAVGPFYVAAGFALYLNRRVRLEAWDIDIAFRRIASAHKKNTVANVSGSRVSIVLSVLFTGFLFLGDTGKLIAEEVSTQIKVSSTEKEYVHEKLQTINEDLVVDGYDNLSKESAKYTINWIKSGDNFHDIERMRIPDIDWWNFDDDKNSSNFPDWLPGLFELLFWIVVLSAVIWIVYRYRSWLMSLVPASSVSKKERHTPSMMFGLDVSKQSLPKYVDEEACKLLNEGHHREALALLYRACLSYLISADYEIEESFTELECLSYVTQQQNIDTRSLQSIEEYPTQLPDTALSYFKELTQVWRQLAYAHKKAPDQELLNLCENWSNLWLADRKIGESKIDERDTGGDVPLDVPVSNALQKNSDSNAEPKSKRDGGEV